MMENYFKNNVCICMYVCIYIYIYNNHLAVCLKHYVKYNYIHICVYIREGDDTPLQYSCLENLMDGGAW